MNTNKHSIRFGLSFLLLKSGTVCSATPENKFRPEILFGEMPGGARIRATRQSSGFLFQQTYCDESTPLKTRNYDLR